MAFKLGHTTEILFRARMVYNTVCVFSVIFVLFLIVTFYNSYLKLRPCNVYIYIVIIYSNFCSNGSSVITDFVLSNERLNHNAFLSCAESVVDKQHLA
jgi:hypothetical protein